MRLFNSNHARHPNSLQKHRLDWAKSEKICWFVYINRASMVSFEVKLFNWCRFLSFSVLKEADFFQFSLLFTIVVDLPCWISSYKPASLPGTAIAWKGRGNLRISSVFGSQKANKRVPSNAWLVRVNKGYHGSFVSGCNAQIAYAWEPRVSRVCIHVNRVFILRWALILVI